MAIHVLHVLHSTNSGGTENMIMNLYRKIDRKKIQFDFLVHTEEKGIFDDEIINLGGNIYHIPYFNIINYFQYRKFLEKFFSEHDEIKIVHGHLGSCACIYLKIAKKYGKITIAHSHNTWPQRINLKDLAYRFFNYPTRKVAQYFFACSLPAGLDRYGEKIVNSSNFRILYNAIDVNKFRFNERIRKKIRKEFSIKDNDKLLINVGRFEEQKNHLFLIEVFNNLCKTNNNYKLMLVGGGSLEGKIRDLIKKYNLTSKVIFTGYRSDVNELLQGADMFVFPSLYEGLGLVLVEAQASGLNIIASDTIPNEVKLSDLVHFLKIDKLDNWVNEITKLGISKNRIQANNIICDSNYNIDKTIKWLTSFYESLLL